MKPFEIKHWWPSHTFTVKLFYRYFLSDTEKLMMDQMTEEENDLFPHLIHSSRADLQRPKVAL